MTLTLHAQPYDITALGFFFESYDDYAKRAAKTFNDYGSPVEEFDIQFIDGETIDCALARAICLDQANIKTFFRVAEYWDDSDKIRMILAVGECGCDLKNDPHPSDFDLDVYESDSLRDLAEEFVLEGLFGDIPDRLEAYIDYDAIARDLSVEFTETEVAGTRLIYRCV